MSNPILAAMQGAMTRNALNNPKINSLVQLFKSKGDPAAFLQNNPQYGGIISALKGKDPRTVFYEECSRRNINPDDIIGMLK